MLKYNKMKVFVKTTLICLLVLSILNGFCTTVVAYVMSSSNYQIQADNALVPTGGIGTTVNYIFRDTMGEVSTGLSDSALYKIKAGFQEMLETYISVSVPDDISLTPAIPGVSGGTATGNATWTVVADGSSGFSMNLQASTTPAMKMPSDPTYYFSDHTLTPSYGWTAPDTGVASFGFTIAAAIAADTVTAFKDNGAACGAGSNTGGCWSGFNGTNNISVINRSTRTDNDGEDEIVNFKAQSAGKLLKDGQYQATITTTVSTN